jgi:hypothetical protein
VTGEIIKAVERSIGVGGQHGGVAANDFYFVLKE